MAAKVFQGGTLLESKLLAIATALQSAKAVQVGFLEGSTYADGTSLPMVAATQEFGARVQVPERTITLYRKTDKSGNRFLKNGRFVKESQANFSSEHTVPAHVIVIPPRPYFRRMIAENSPLWGKQTAALLKANAFNAAKTLAQMGELIQGQLQTSIRNLNDPPNAPSTVAGKGFNKPLIDTGHMLDSVDYEVIE